MTLHGWIAVLSLALAAVFFYKRWLPQEAVALGIPLVLHLTGVLSVQDALSGFGNEAVIAIGAVFVIGAGLQESGVTSFLARMIERAGGKSLHLLTLALMTITSIVGSVMNRPAVVAALTPAVMTLSRRTGHAPSKLFMPLAFGATLGSNFLLISSLPTLIVADYARTEFGVRMGMFDFAPGGLLMAVAGIGAMVLFGLRVLPERSPEARLRAAAAPEEAATRYGLGKTLFRMRVLAQSRISGKTIADAELRKRYGLDVVAVRRQRRRILGDPLLDPKPDLVLAPDDELFVEGDDEAAFRFSEGEIVQLGLAGPREIEAILGRGMMLAEVTLSPHSGAPGSSARDLDFRAKFGLNVLGIWRRGKAVEGNVAEVPLELGDAFLVSGKPEGVALLSRDPDWIVLTEHAHKEDSSRAPLALLLLAVAVVPPLLDWAPLAVSALIAAVLMIATGCLSAADARRSVDLRILLLTIGLVPLGIAIKDTGVADAAANGLFAVASPLGSSAILVAIFVLAMLVATFTVNSAAALVVQPIAATIAVSAGIPVTTALLAVAFGANATFLFPFSAANLMVMGPGGYETKDFLAPGMIVTLAVLPVAIAVLAFSLR